MTKSKKIKESKAARGAQNSITNKSSAVAKEKTPITAETLDALSKKATELKDEISTTLERQANLDILKEDNLRKSEQIVQLEKSLEGFNGVEGERANEKAGQGGVDESRIEPSLVDSSNNNAAITESTVLEHNNNNGQPIKDKTIEVSKVAKVTALSIETQESNAIFEPLEAHLDPDSKCSLLMASMKRHIAEQNNGNINNHESDTKVASISPQLIGSLLEPLCRKLVELSDSRESYRVELESEQSRRLKMERLCRELQKSNNAIRIESLDLIHAEQKRAKEQGAKIQDTLAGVMKLFNENQERNVAICKENRDLQTKLVNLLEHCGNWERSVETTLKEKDLTIKLAKTQVAKSELLRHEEKESWLEQKKDYLKIIQLLQQKQSVMEAQSEKLKKELNVNMEKYELFHKQVGEKTNKFQKESNVLFDRMEKSSMEHKMMVESYEKLLNENRKWVKANELSAKKIEALEKLCRTLRKNKLQVSTGVDKEQKTTSPYQQQSSAKSNETKSSININANDKQQVEKKPIQM